MKVFDLKEGDRVMMAIDPKSVWSDELQYKEVKKGDWGTVVKLPEDLKTINYGGRYFTIAWDNGMTLEYFTTRYTFGNFIVKVDDDKWVDLLVIEV